MCIMVAELYRLQDNCVRTNLCILGSSFTKYASIGIMANLRNNHNDRSKRKCKSCLMLCNAGLSDFSA
jgi:hypothetical protein